MKNFIYDLTTTVFLFLTAIIWGFAFLFQKTAMESLGPYYFTGFRFLLGTLFLFPFFYKGFLKLEKKNKLKTVQYGSVAGIFLFGGTILQQIGLVYTTVNKASFITALYICLVPLVNLFFKKKIFLVQWSGVFFAVVGFYFLTIQEKFILAIEDSILLLGALMWAFHILWVDYAIKKKSYLFQIAFFQVLLVCILSFIAAFFLETFQWQAVKNVLIEIIYTGVFSVAIAFTLQIKAQQRSHPTFAALVFSTEAVFATFFSWVFLNEMLTSRQFLGSTIIFLGIMVCQLRWKVITNFWRKTKS